MAENKITKATFDKVKELADKKVTMSDIAALTKLSVKTISRIRNATDFDSYKQQLRAIHTDLAKKNNPSPVQPSAEPKPPIQTIVKIEATHYMMEELHKTNETLARIARQHTILMEATLALLESLDPDRAAKILQNVS